MGSVNFFLEIRGGQYSVLQEGGFGLCPSGGGNDTLPPLPTYDDNISVVLFNKKKELNYSWELRQKDFNFASSPGTSEILTKFSPSPRYWRTQLRISLIYMN